MDEEMITKIKEYEDLLKEIQVYFYKSVECRVKTAQENRAWVERINNVIYNKPQNGIKR